MMLAKGETRVRGFSDLRRRSAWGIGRAEQLLPVHASEEQPLAIDGLGELREGQVKRHAGVFKRGGIDGVNCRRA